MCVCGSGALSHLYMYQSGVRRSWPCLVGVYSRTLGQYEQSAILPTHSSHSPQIVFVGEIVSVSESQTNVVYKVVGGWVHRE